MKRYAYKVISAKDASDQEIAEFAALIYAYGAVKGTLEEITERVRAADTLCFIRCDGRMVATAALKKPKSSYRERLKTKTKVSLPEAEFPLEMGYVVVVKGYRGDLPEQGRLSACVMKTVMGQDKGRGVFATTKIEGFRKSALPALGFKEVGQYKNKEDEDIYILVRPDSSGSDDVPNA